MKIKLIIVLLTLIFVVSCGNNKNEQAVNTTIKLLESIQKDDYEAFKNLLYLPEDEYEFDRYKLFFNDSILVKYKKERTNPKDTIFPFKEPFNIKNKYIKMHYYTSPEDSPAAFKKLNLYLFFDETVQDDFNQALSINLAMDE